MSEKDKMIFINHQESVIKAFMTSEKGIERHNNVIKESIMTSEKSVEHHENVMITS